AQAVRAPLHCARYLNPYLYLLIRHYYTAVQAITGDDGRPVAGRSKLLSAASLSFCHTSGAVLVMNWYAMADTLALVIFSIPTKRSQVAASVRKHNNVAERQRFRAGCPGKSWRSCCVHANLRALC